MEYISIPLQLAPNTVQNVYVRQQQQSVKDDDSDNEDFERTLFVTNLPLDTTDENVKDICEALGGVVLDNFIRQGQRHGLIALVDEAAARRFLSKARKLSESKKRAIGWEQYGPRGAEGYLAKHMSRFPEEFELQERVDEYMELFAEQEREEEEAREHAAQYVDEDGFRTVIYGRKRAAAAEEPVEEPKPKKNKLEKTDFYRFQLREKRKGETSDLLRRYQEDKKKVEELKNKRVYRPY